MTTYLNKPVRWDRHDPYARHVDPAERVRECRACGEDYQPGGPCGCDRRTQR